MLRERLKKWGVGLAIVLPLACSETPSKKVAAGQDTNLYKKSDLVGGGYLTNALDAKSAALVDGMGENAKAVKFEVSKNFLTIYSGLSLDGATTPARQFAIKGHWDLKAEKNKDGEENQYLVKNNTDNPNWQDRAYIEVDAFDPKRIKAEEATMVNLFAVDSVKKSYTFGEEAIPGVSAREQEALGKQFDLVTGDKVLVKLTKTEMILYVNSAAGNPVVISRSAVSYFDLVRSENDIGEETAEIVRDTKAVWSKRQYVEISPEGMEILDGEKKMIDKNALIGQCYEPNEAPIAEVNAIIAKQGKKLASGDKLCFDVNQTILSVYVKGEDKSENLLFTFDIVDHVDVNLGGEDFFDVLASGTQTRTWDRRKYVRIKTNNPKFAENHVGPNVMDKANFKGEYIYVATVVAAHSENGLVFDGLTFTGKDRVEFDLAEGALTTYKVGEKLNQSGSRTPSLRFSADHFDVERVRNSYGDGTNVIGETKNRPWSERQNVRVNWESNEINGIYNELFSTVAILGSGYLQSASKLASEVTIEDGFIMYDTEETLTPVVNTPGEVGAQPMGVTVRHAFMRVDNRDYQPRVYNGADFNRFGYFRTTDRGLDEDGRATDDTLNYYIGRHDVSNGKKIVFYLSPDYPERYADTTREVIDAWNETFKMATGRDNVIELRENSGQKVGDPRYNMIWYTHARALSSPAGYGPSVPDPLTGEFVSSRTLMYDSAFRFYRRAMGDYYDLIKEGKLPSDFENENNPPISGIPGTPAGGTSRPTDPFAGIGDVRTEFAAAMPEFKAGWDSLSKEVKGAPVDVTRALDKLAQHGVGDVSSVFNSDLVQNFKFASDFNGMIAKEKKIDGYLAGRGQCMYGVNEHVLSAVEFIKANIEMDRDELMDKLDQLSYFSVLVHELGHNFGLRHNFYGSFDSFNFHEEYRVLKAKEDAGEQTPGDYSLNYRTSSVMDYVDMFEGLAKKPGLYDTAAVMYGYGNKLEVVQFTEDGQIARDETGFPLFEAKAVSEITQNDLLRPYMFCTDGHVWNEPTCNRFDRGLTISDITDSFIQQYDYDYFMRGFRRGLRSFSGDPSRVLTRTILPVRQVLDETFYKLISGEFEGQETSDPVEPGNFADYVQALNAGFAFFAEVLETVEPGEYNLDPDTKEVGDGFSNKEGAQNIVVPLGVGKYLESAFRPGPADFGDESELVVRRGIEFDKMATMWALTLRGYPAPKYQRISLAANYFAIAKEPLLDIFSKYIQESYETEITAVKDPESGVFVAVGDAPADSEIEVANFTLPANTNLSMKFNAIIYAMLNYNSSADRTFGDYVDFRIKGVDDASLPAGIEKVEFTNVNGIKTYVIPQTADGQSISFAIAKDAGEKSAERDELLTQAEEFDATIAAAVEGGFDSVLAAVQVIYEQAFGGPLDPGTVDSFANNKTPENMDTLIGFIASIEAQATTGGDEELLAVINEQKPTYEPAVAGFAEAFGSKGAIETQADDIARDLTSIESDLLLLQDLYQILK